ncbi:MAG TPA: WG repeat-containing protein [Bacteroidia bacterium]|jgi:hypothetical protein|nr:WG repeat-containing protein [Bacteroidia bacterium]
MRTLLTLCCLVLILNINAQGTLIRVEVNGKIGFGYPDPVKKDKLGYPTASSIIIPAIYDETTGFAETTEGLAGVKKDGKWGFIDHTGATKIPFKYDEAGFFAEGLAFVSMGGKYGFINKTGALVIPCKYEQANTFSEGLAYVVSGGKVGFINKTGVMVIPARYDAQTPAGDQKCGTLYVFDNGKAKVSLNGKCGEVDKKGVYIESPVEVMDSVVFSGTMNAKKDRWGGNPGAKIKGTCDTKMDIKKILLNDKDITGYISYENHMMYIGFTKMKAGDKVVLKILSKKGVTFKLEGEQGFDIP